MSTKISLYYSDDEVPLEDRIHIWQDCITGQIHIAQFNSDDCVILSPAEWTQALEKLRKHYPY